MKTPFGRASDLGRHRQSAHNSGLREFACRLPSCPKEFAREDHLTKHMREQHTTYPCPFNHCRDGVAGRFIFPEDVESHILRSHGKYECALGSCAKTSPSRFWRNRLVSHLNSDHGYTDSIFRINTAEATNGDLVTFTQEHLGRRRVRECKCGEAGPTNATPLSG